MGNLWCSVSKNYFFIPVFVFNKIKINYLKKKVYLSLFQWNSVGTRIRDIVTGGHMKEERSEWHVEGVGCTQHWDGVIYDFLIIVGIRCGGNRISFWHQQIILRHIFIIIYFNFLKQVQAWKLFALHTYIYFF